MAISKSVHPTDPDHVGNTTDATRGEPLAARARMRRSELEKSLALSGETSREHGDIELALAEGNQWLTGDADHVAQTTAEDINRWLEASRRGDPEGLIGTICAGIRMRVWVTSAANGRNPIRDTWHSENRERGHDSEDISQARASSPSRCQSG